MSDQLHKSQEKNSELNTLQKNSLLRLDFHAKIYQSLEKEQDSKVQEAVSSLRLLESSEKLDLKSLSLKTSKVFSPITEEKPLRSYFKRLPTLGFMSANGNCLIQSGYYPKIESEYTLLDILEEEVDQKYFLSPKAISYLQRAVDRGREGERQLCSTITRNYHKGVHNQGETYVKLEKLDKKLDKKLDSNNASCLCVGGNSGGNHSDMDLLKITTATNLQGKDVCNTIRGGGGGSLTDKHNWDMVRVGTLRTHKDGEGFREVKDGNCPTIPAGAREDGSGQPVIKVTGLSMERTEEGKKLRKQYESGELKHGFNEHRKISGRKDGCSNTIDTNEKSQRIIIKPVLTPDRIEKRQNGRRFKDDEDPMFTLTAQDKHGAQINEQIRRLTPVECMRLQGFPDDWSDVGLYVSKEVQKQLKGKTEEEQNAIMVDAINNSELIAKPISDTQKYKQTGNAVTVDIVEIIGWRLDF